MSPRPNTASQETHQLDQLAVRVAQGDQSAAEMLFNALWPQCVRHGMEVLRRHGRYNHADAEDIAAAILAKAFERINEYDSARASVVTWIKAFVMNAAIDHLKKASTRREHTVEAVDPEEDGAPDPISAAADPGPTHMARLCAREVANEILDVLYALEPPHYRDCLIGRWLLCLPDRVLADYDGVTETSVRSTVHRALKAFEVAFREKLPEFRDADIDALSRFFREGAFVLTEVQQQQLSAVENQAVHGCMNGTNNAGGTMKVHVSVAVAALVKKKPRRAPVSADPELFGRLLSAAVSAAWGVQVVLPVGDQLAECAKQIPSATLMRRLGIDIHQLHALFNNTVPPVLANNKAFVCALARMLGISNDETQRVINAAQPPVLAGTTRARSTRKRAATLKRILVMTATRAHAKKDT